MTDGRKLYVHCGLHKTATTLVQASLGNHTMALAAQGLHIPITGTTPQLRAAHHNIAHAMIGDARFDPSLGTVDDLVTELRGLDGDAFLSSEDFGSLLWREDGPERLKELARDSGREAVVILTLREQTSYVVSRYLQVMKRGYFAEIRNVVDTVLDLGLFPLPPEAMARLDFADLIAGLERKGLKVAIRNYHAMEEGPVNDILQATGYVLPPLQATGNGKVNVTKIDGKLAEFLGSQLEVRSMRGHALLRAACADIPVAARLSAALNDRFAERFRPDLEALWRDREIDLSIGRPSPVADGQIPLDAAFSTETVVAARELLAKSSGVGPGSRRVRAAIKRLGRKFDGILVRGGRSAAGREQFQNHIGSLPRGEV